jgi:hypothetical protein
MKYYKNYKQNIFLSLIALIFTIGFLHLFNILNYKENMIDENKTNKTNGVEIIVSRYNEDLEWLNSEIIEDFPVIIYNKGLNEDFYKPQHLKNVISLDNVGVCVHTYLYHIIENYDNLSDVTIFLPGSCMDDHKKEKTMNTIKKTKDTKNTVFYAGHFDKTVASELYNFSLDNYSLANSKNKDLNSDKTLNNCDIRPFGKWYETLFPNIDISHVNYYGIFSVSREHILNRSKESYEELIQYVNKNKNEECAHYFERAFFAVFYPIPEECIYV